MQTHSATSNLGLMRRSEGLSRAEEGSGEESARASAFCFGEIRVRTSYVPVKSSSVDNFVGSKTLRFLRSEMAMRRIFLPKMQRMVL